VATPDNCECSLPLRGATDASLQLARQVARLLSEAMQQIHSAAIEAATHAVAAERQQTVEEWERKYAGFARGSEKKRHMLSELFRKRPRLERGTAQAAAAESLKNELPRWLRPQLDSYA